MRFTDRLRRRAARLWAKAHGHPFVQGIGDGTLPGEKFRFYLRQDYLFLIEYCRVLALAAAKAPSLEAMSFLAKLLDSTLNVEMGLHRSLCERFGITPQELERSSPAPTTVAYTRHLLSVAYAGTAGEIVASLLPCQWGYCEIGQELARRGEPTAQPLYGEWVRSYASGEYAELVERLRGYADRLGQAAGTAERRRMAEVFLTSSRYEYLFWEMAWRTERWPL
ncbi:MAG: thiaminase II [Chloroflexi bacterium]|nr:thiaminase II [Chloroflexota bacterium]